MEHDDWARARLARLRRTRARCEVRVPMLHAVVWWWRGEEEEEEGVRAVPRRGRSLARRWLAGGAVGGTVEGVVRGVVVVVVREKGNQGRPGRP